MKTGPTITSRDVDKYEYFITSVMLILAAIQKRTVFIDEANSPSNQIDLPNIFGRNFPKLKSSVKVIFAEFLER